MNPAEAIAELKELSTQIEAVVLAGRDGRAIASSLATEPAARLAADAATLVAGADDVRRDLGREGLPPVQAATPDGSVFVALDGDRMAVATTGGDPTVGLVFYDLKTLLRQTADDPVDDVVSAAKEDDVEA
jgi:predicted regulator of Ras-like GTPase activity (Roadblock/LC7/MglB family)